jgi:hypothetical protein
MARGIDGIKRSASLKLHELRKRDSMNMKVWCLHQQLEVLPRAIVICSKIDGSFVGSPYDACFLNHFGSTVSCAVRNKVTRF